MKNASTLTASGPRNDISFQSASIDIWDKKYRLKTKSGEALDADIDHTYQRMRERWPMPKQLPKNKSSGTPPFSGHLETGQFRLDGSSPMPEHTSTSRPPARSTARYQGLFQTR